MWSYTAHCRRGHTCPTQHDFHEHDFRCIASLELYRDYSRAHMLTQHKFVDVIIKMTTSTE